MDSTACFKGGLIICTLDPLIALTNKYPQLLSKKKKNISTLEY